MRTLTNCSKLEVRESPIEGFGVFAKDDIPAGTVLEEVPFVLFPRYVTLARSMYDTLKVNGWVSSKEIHMENIRENLGFKTPEKYYFKWHPPVQLDGDSMFTVLPLGFGPCYNTSNTANNADWKMMRDTFVFKADKPIKKDEEIRTFYGYFLGEDGTTFNCESVFHSAIDMFSIDGRMEHRVKMLRFGSIETFNSQRANPAAVRIHQCLLSSVDGLFLKKITLYQSNGDQLLTTGDLPTDIKLTALYLKLVEYMRHPAPVVKFTYEFTDLTSNKKVVEEILWKK